MPELAAHLERAKELVNHILEFLDEGQLDEYADIAQEAMVNPVAAALAACAREEHKLACPRCIPRLRCIGYPDCDGDLVAEEHSKKCLAIGVMTLPCERLRALERAAGEKA